MNDQLVDLFLAESSDMLAAASDALLTAEATGRTEDAVNQMFRAFHSIKGGAMSLDFGELAETAHRLEDLLDLARQGALVIDETVINLIFRSIDWMEGQMQALAGNNPDQEIYAQTRPELMAAIEAILDGVTIQAPVQEVAANPAAKVMLDPAKKIIYCEMNLSESAPMPAATMFLLMQRLAEEGAILFSNPTQAELLAGTVDEQVLRVLINTDDNGKAIRKAMNMHDVAISRLCDVSGESEKDCLREWPTVEALSEFQQTVAQMAAGLEAKELGNVQLLTEKIANWGEPGKVNNWFPGGETCWRGIAGMLWLCADLLADSPSFLIEQRFREGLATIWQGVFNALDCSVYYLTLQSEEDECLGASDLVGQVLAKPDARLVLVELTHAKKVLEYQDIQALLDAKRHLAGYGVKLALVGYGHLGRNHQNVLEAVSPLTGGLAVWPTAYEACWRAIVEDEQGGMCR